MNNQKKLLEVIDSLCNGNQSEFARRMGMPQPTIASWLKRGTLDYEKIISVFPELSAEWLLREEGDMLRCKMIEKSSVKERLLIFLRYLGESQKKFEMACGLSNGYINNIKISISPSKLDKITSKHPELNPGWLMTGEGEMLKNSTTQTSSGDNSPNISGNGNHVNNAATIDKALNEIAEQRKLVSKSQEQITKSQEQIDRLLGIIEQMTK